MSDVAIGIEDLGKRYRYSGAAPLSYNLRQDIADWVKGLLRRNNKRHATLNEVHERHIADSPEYFWALRNVNLEINRGDVVGIIGRNGAGKSTLLKLLSRITPPTTGKITLYGRVASLLEVGTGFHRELTGRENIFLNGSILGMRRAEILSKFDEIVAFAEIDKFIDTPVKFYSSGMYVRLAFAVAAHLEPEILVVDEVLAVGDAAFQKKCLGKMGEVAKQGRTVLFVSHNIAAIEALCSKGYMLEKGTVFKSGATGEVIQAYMSSFMSNGEQTLGQRTDRKGDGKLRFRDVSFRSIGQTAAQSVQCGSDLEISLGYESKAESLRNTVLSITIHNAVGQCLLLFDNEMVGCDFASLPSTGRLNCLIKRFPLAPGQYHVNLYCEVNGSLADWIQQAAQLTVEPGDFYGTGRLPPASHGGVLVSHKWIATGPTA